MKLTAKQREVYELHHEQGIPLRAIARQLGLHRSTVDDHWKRAKTAMIRDGADPERFAPGATTEVDADGTITRQWIRTPVERQSREALTEAIRESLEGVKPLPTIKAPKGNIKDSMVIMPMGDPHVGLYAYYKEAGEDFDCDIAERDLLAATDYLVTVAPPTEECLIINLGDYFHGDSSRNQTTAGTPVDLDTRWSRVLQIGISILIRVVERALEKHKKVTVVNATGNHDTESSVFLCVAMWHHFKDNKRVEIREPNMFHYYTFGDNLIGICHGHSVKKERLPGVMAMDQSVAWGKSKHRYWYTGHIHHRTVLEIDGSLVESFRTLAAKDAWHHGQGYRAGRDMNAIVMHRTYGETDRHRCDILRARA